MHRCEETPLGMTRGSATSDLQYSYFTPHNSPGVYRYEWCTEKWDKWNTLPPCPYHDSALVIIDGALTAVGGCDYKGRCTNKLFTLRERDIVFSMKVHKTYRRWVEELPPMKMARSRAAVVSTSDGEYVVVIGGFYDRASVELFQVRSRRWCELTDLPQPLSHNPSATICGNLIHVIGDDCNGFSCSLQDLPSSDLPATSQSRSHTISWSPLTPLPVTDTTAATLCGQLVIVGGWRGRLPVNSIHQLVDDEWVEIGSMSREGWQCLVVSPSPDKMMTVGGLGAVCEVWRKRTHF